MPSPFIRPLKRPQCPGTDFVPVEDDLIVTYDVKDKVVKTGEGEFDYILKQVVFVKDKTPRSQAINAGADEVGILNVMKKVARTGDLTLLNQRSDSIPSNIDTIDIESELNAALAAKKNFANLDPDLIGNKTFKEFTETGLTQAEFDAYIEKKVQAKLAEQAAHTEEVTNNG